MMRFVLGLTVMVLAACSSGPAQTEISPLGLQISGPQEILADSVISLRIVVTDHSQNRPVSGALVSVRLAKAGGLQSEVLLTARSDARGQVDGSCEIPDLAPGAYELIVRARWGNLREEARQSVRVRAENQMLLTTDKPLYKPAQTVHLRALALRRPTLRALVGSEIVFEVSDPKGNKLFKKAARTNDFGVAFTEFKLGDDINLGEYRVRALVGGQQVEKTITVKRYVLPKFRVTLTPDRPFYLPGEKVSGKVQADYFFGKPVSGGQVRVTLKTFDVAFQEIGVLTGQTDAQGAYRFESKLPDRFVGQPLEQGKALLQFAVEVVDQAEHTERATLSSRVAAAPVEVNLIAESGRLVPGVENLVYVLVSRPTGEPIARARVRLTCSAKLQGTLRLPAGEVLTDELGIAEVKVQFDPAAPTGDGAPMRWGRMAMPQIRVARFEGDTEFGANLPVEVQATSPDGTTIKRALPLPLEAGQPQGNLLLRTDRVLAEVGDTITATALTDAARGTVYFDVIKDRQTVLTAAADIQGGRATLPLPLTPDITGTVWLSAYRIMPDGQIVRASRPLFVNPANDLNINIKTDRDTYRPGAENVAAVNFTVTDSRGRPVAAALGVNVVDESLFAIQEMQPGLERVYFYLEKEIATPRYEIHGLEMPVIIGRPPGEARPLPLGQDARKQQAARVMLASARPPSLSLFTTDTYAERLEQLRAEWLKLLAPRAQKIQQAINEYNDRQRRQPLTTKEMLAPLLRAKLLQPEDLKDPWGRDLAFAAADPQDDRLHAVIMWSYGYDGLPNTADDLYLSSIWPRELYSSLEMARANARPMLPMAVMARGGALEGAPLPAVPDAGAGSKTTAADGAGGDQPVRVRQFFPETLLVEPALITDASGRATLQVPMADSITSWRITALANSVLGGLGSATGALRCFQDFFIDIDLPVALTQGDRIAVPVAVYNYLPAAQKVRLKLTRADWFELSGPDEQELTLTPNEVNVRYFTITAQKLGSGKLLVHGYGAQMSDAIERVADIEPNGKLLETTASGRLSGMVSETVTFPADAIAEAGNLLVKIYPGMFSQAVEGLDSILQMPFGCFEQASSTTYPNVLVLDYMKTTGQVTPAIQMKAEGLINNGYQQLMTFEVTGGGFSWFGEAPANKILTAFGIMQFFDMARVHTVDPALLQRTQQWLLKQQQADGSWKADEQYLHQESWSRIQNSQLPPTSYITWGLTYSGCKLPGVEQAVAYLRAHADEAKDPYVLAMLANALVNADLLLTPGKLAAGTEQVLERLVAAAKRQDGQMWWETELTGVTHSSGKHSDLEATGMAALALIAAGRHGEASEVLTYLIGQKDARGTWHSTQATTLALRALMASQKSSTSTVAGTVTVTLNGKEAARLKLTPENADVLQQVDGKAFMKTGANEVTLKFEGQGSTLYQVVGKYYLPWEKIRSEGRGLLDIEVKYDRTTLNKDDLVTAEVMVRNNAPGVTSMVIVDLGIPPGFDVQAEDLAELVEKGVLQRYSLTGRQIICYLERLTAGQTLKFHYRLRAKFPLTAQTPKSTVYEYYNTDNRADAIPVELQVK